jgi:ribose-phosphate pyrophosphokinase
MSLKIVAGSANCALGEAVAKKLGLDLVGRVVERFPDSEMHVEIRESVRGYDVYIVQPTCPPVDEHLIELLLIADACRRAGADRLTAVIPYFGYARQDRRARGREPVSARVMADMIRAGGLDRVVALDLHGATLEGVLSIPLEHLTAVPLLAEAARSSVGSGTVVVSPDLGAVKLAERYGKILRLPVAIVHKTRLGGAEVAVRNITGEVKGKPVLIVDDMITTGGTVQAAIRALLDAGSAPDFVVAASHGLFVDGAAERFRGLPVRRFFSTDSVPAPIDFAPPVQTISAAPLFAETIERLHNRRSLGELIRHG